MKKIKVYVDELPESCKTCQFQCYGECRNGCDILKTDYSMTQCHIMRGKHKDCPLIDIKTHDKEILEEQREKTFILYSLLYQELEKQDIENVASRIDYMTSENYADICELYKTAKNLKQHDRELVNEVCEKIHNDLKPHYGEEVSAVIIERVLSNLQKEFEK